MWNESNAGTLANSNRMAGPLVMLVVDVTFGSHESVGMGSVSRCLRVARKDVGSSTPIARCLALS